MVEVLIKSLIAIMTKLVMAVSTKPLIEWFLFYVAKQIVKSTKTPHDDVFYSKIKAAYESQREVRFNVTNQ